VGRESRPEVEQIRFYVRKLFGAENAFEHVETASSVRLDDVGMQRSIAHKSNRTAVAKFLGSPLAVGHVRLHFSTRFHS